MAKTSAQRQKEYRERHGIVKQVNVNLTQSQWETVCECLEKAKFEGSAKEFYAAALVQGSKFRANAGQGKKIKSKK